MAKGRRPPIESVSIPLHEMRPPDLPPLEELKHPPTPPTGEPHATYAFENLAFEGGGAKGMAYLGVLQVLEKEGLYPNHIRRVAGTSSGSFFAALLAVGASSEELSELLFNTDMVSLLKDARFGRVSAMFNIFTEFGFNPGIRLLQFLGERLEERTGSMDVTFRQVLERCGRELCVPITNITRMCTEYCHPKTTPDMPVRLAVGMSMSLPVLMRPYRLVRKMGHPGWEEEDLYTDGGLLCNFPLHVFDGWWLSMNSEDSFVKRLAPLAGTAGFRNPLSRFEPRNGKTLGFTVFDMDERDATAAWVPEGGGPPSRPDTLLARLRRENEEAYAHKMRQSGAFGEAFGRLMAAMANAEVDGDGRVSAEECKRLLSCGALTALDTTLLFGTEDPDEIFAILDRDGDGHICPEELMAFMDQKNVDITARAIGFRRSESTSVARYLTNVFQTMLFHIRKLNLRAEDRARTVPIDTDYVGTAHFALQEDDRRFLMETGVNATRAFLRRYREEHGADAEE